MALAEVAGGAFCPLSRVTPTSTVCEPTLQSADACRDILVKIAVKNVATIAASEWSERRQVRGGGAPRTK